MVNFADYVMKKRDRGELTTGLVLYGETEPPEMQIENLWKIVHRRTGEDLADPRPDFDEFSSSDRMYPSMMKPEVKRRWDLKNYEWEETKAQHAKLKRMVHAQFMQENPNLPVVQGLKGTTYGSEIQAEFKKMLSGKQSILKSRMPKAGTGQTIRDELERDNVDLNEIADEVIQFQTPKSWSTFAVLGVDRDETLRIAGKVLASAESSHVLEYQYDDEGRLQVVHYAGKPVEVYRYNRMGQRVFSQVSGDQPLKYSYNELGQLVQAGDVAYTYDEDGYLAGKKDSHGLTRYRYLENGQLCGVQLPDGREIEYSFDENGFRAEKLINGKLVQRYQWDDLITLSAVEDKSGVIRFRYDEDGDAIGMIRNGQKLLLATDQLGTVFTVADLSGNSVQEVLYDSFGVMIQNSRPELALPLGFAGGLYDPDTGLIHFGYREYDPAIGRFISPDPLGYAGGDVDLYGYCGDDPVNFVDRLGLSDTSEASEDDESQEEQKEKSDESKKDVADSEKKDKKKPSKKNKGYMVGVGASGAVPGIEAGGSLDFVYIDEDEAAIVANGDVKGSSSLGATLDFSAGTHNASKAEDLEGASTTASVGATIPGTPVSGGYSKGMSKASTTDKAYLSVGKKVNPALIPEVSGGRSTSKVLVKFNPPFDEMAESGRSIGKAIVGTIDNNLNKQAKSRKTTPRIPPRTSVRRR